MRRVFDGIIVYWLCDEFISTPLIVIVKIYEYDIVVSITPSEVLKLTLWLVVARNVGVGVISWGGVISLKHLGMVGLCQFRPDILKYI